ncbi:MAG: flagellar biosynthetic protein FliQ [Acidobacteria bacterium]|nr:flagellar biosynthetic protein FliQ [Acidobacteriota bacterium]
MTPDFVVETLRQCLLATLWLSAPLLALGFLVGIGVSLLQIVTSIQDTAFSTVPRLAAFLVAFLLFLPWMLMKLMAYTTSILGDLAKFAR